MNKYMIPQETALRPVFVEEKGGMFSLMNCNITATTVDPVRARYAYFFTENDIRTEYRVEMDSSALKNLNHDKKIRDFYIIVLLRTEDGIPFTSDIVEVVTADGQLRTTTVNAFLLARDSLKPNI